MQRQQTVLIGIQARSTSKRLPNKGEALIGDKTMTEMILHNVNEAVSFMRRQLRDQSPLFHVVLLIPDKDPLKRYAGQVAVMEGDEHDVLERYFKAMVFYRPEYIVRITGDCPLLPDFIISKHIRSALYGSFDYISNVDPAFRTSPDGFDCEVMSKRMLRWARETARSNSDKEHVTTIMRREPPEWAKIGHIIDHLDYSKMKVSVDTVEDLERVREQHAAVEKAVNGAKALEGRVVFRL